MKKCASLFFILLISVCSSFAFALDEDAKTEKNEEDKNKKEEVQLTEAEVLLLKNRVEEIRDMDKSEMTRTEKRELRKELKEIKKTVNKNSNGGYIYISVGTVLLIVLLILLLR